MSELKSAQAIGDGWQHASLGKLLPLKYGKGLPAQLRDPNGTHPVYGSSGMVGTHSAALTNGPTLIVGRKGNVGAVHYSAVPCWPIDTAYFVEAPAGHNLRYYKYLLESLNLVKLDRSTAIPGLSRDDYNAVEVSVAPPEQQDEIVAEIEKQFSRLDEAVANLQRVKANLKRYKASVLKDAVEGRLVPTEAELARSEGRTFETGEQLLHRILETRRKEWKGRGKYKEPVAANTDALPALSDGWTWATIEQLTYLVTSGSRGWGDFYSDSGVLFIRAQDIKTDALNMKGLARVDVPVDAEGSRSSVGANDILVTITGANVTKSALVPMLSEPAFVSQHVALLKLTSSDTAAFVFNWLVSPANGRKTLEKWAYGAGKPGLSLEQIRALPIALPPLTEQTRVVDEVERRLSLVRGVESEVDANLKRAQALGQSVLQRAFSAEITFRDSSESNVAQVEPLIEPHAFTAEPVSVVIAARIIAANCSEPTFGRVKLQKILYLATHHGQVQSANDEYVRKQAGPLDMQMLGGVIKRLDDLRWFREAERTGKSPRDKAYSYSALTKADDHKRHLHVLTPAQQKVIDGLNQLMRTWSTEDCELFVTVYAAWNDLILVKHEPTVEAITYEVRENWHESKKKFSPEQIAGVIDKIRRLGYGPTGFGRPTSGKAVDTQTGELF